MRIYILLTFLIYSIDAFASIRQNLTTLDNSTDLDYGNQSTNRDILIEIEILPRAWRWKIDAYGKLHQLRVLSIVQFILPTSLVIPPVLGITSLWREVEKPEHYKLYRNWIVCSMLFTIFVSTSKNIVEIKIKFQIKYGLLCIALLPLLFVKFDLKTLFGVISK